jgi:predicted nucleotidyltransferase component of viral defense system
MASYATERLLERISRSRLRENLIIKGGTIVASMVGIENRSTMDVDATVKNMPLSEGSVRGIIDELVSIPLDDNMVFTVKSVGTIMDEAEYPGIRILMDASLEKMRIPMKLDFSTDDIITPHEISYPYKLLFEDRSVSVLAYNIETILAEKIQAIVSRGLASTRMRDFYDVYILERMHSQQIDSGTLRTAFTNTSLKRGTRADKGTVLQTLEEINDNQRLLGLWQSYRNKYDYAERVEWQSVMAALRKAFSSVLTMGMASREADKS